MNGFGHPPTARKSRVPSVLAWLCSALIALGAQAGFKPEVLAQLDREIGEAIAAKKCPGAVLWLEHKGEVHHRAYGQRAVRPSPEPMTPDTLFDVASLAKVLATTPAVMLLVERSQVRLDDRVRRHLPEFREPGTEAITVRHLLTHTSGFLVGISGAEFQDAAGAMAVALQQAPAMPPGTTFHYCDLNFILLGEIVRRVAKEPLNEFVAREVFQPLHMVDSGYLPPTNVWARVAPTLEASAGVLRGIVQDPTARRMGGVAGHAGVFSTASDIARFARMMLNEGTEGGVRIFKPETVCLMTSVQSPKPVLARRGLGWDIDSTYSRPRGLVFPLGTYGHTGYTGALLWIDPFSRTFVILLTNRLHPDGKGQVTDLYGVVGTLAARAVDDFDFRHVPGALPFRTNFIHGGGAWTQ